MKDLQLSLPEPSDLSALLNMPSLSKLDLSYADRSPSHYAKTRKAVKAILEAHT